MVYKNPLIWHLLNKVRRSVRVVTTMNEVEGTLITVDQEDGFVEVEDPAGNIHYLKWDHIVDLAVQGEGTAETDAKYYEGES